MLRPIPVWAKLAAISEWHVAQRESACARLMSHQSHNTMWIRLSPTASHQTVCITSRPTAKDHHQ
ncbi:MAG: hypothetical protein JNL98_19280 [Bryobacterales bacterium]|nr:hypothetical protein [Bryobacterales bacterium]